MKMLIYVHIGLLLVSSAPTYAIQMLRTYNPRQMLQGYGEYVGIMTLLFLLDIVVFNFPSHFPFSPLLIGLGLGSGALYYAIERLRLSASYRHAIRLSTKREQPTLTRGTMGLALVWVAIVEEFVFRYYLLFIPISYGFLPPFLAILLSSLAFGFIHQDFGIAIVVSRILFGLALALIVFFTGDFLFAVYAHIIYNILVHVWPMRYTVMRVAPSYKRSIYK